MSATLQRLNEAIANSMGSYVEPIQINEVSFDDSDYSFESYFYDILGDLGLVSANDVSETDEGAVFLLTFEDGSEATVELYDDELDDFEPTVEITVNGSSYKTVVPQSAWEDDDTISAEELPSDWIVMTLSDHLGLSESYVNEVGRGAMGAKRGAIRNAVQYVKTNVKVIGRKIRKSKAYKGAKDRFGRAKTYISNTRLAGHARAGFGKVKEYKNKAVASVKNRYNSAKKKFGDWNDARKLQKMRKEQAKHRAAGHTGGDE